MAEPYPTNAELVQKLQGFPPEAKVQISVMAKAVGATVAEVSTVDWIKSSGPDGVDVVVIGDESA